MIMSCIVLFLISSAAKVRSALITNQGLPPLLLQVIFNI